MMRNVVLRVLDFDAVCNVVSRNNAIEIAICFDPRFGAPSVCVFRFSPETVATERCVKY
jgi:hypothetical protein